MGKDGIAEEIEYTELQGIQYIVGSEDVLKTMMNVPALPCFSEKMVAFLDSLSRMLMKNPVSKGYTDVLSYAFWIRKSSLEKERANHTRSDMRMGRGVAFHIAPSNVPVNFAVSMTSALLAGNACIIRVSNKEFAQVDIICSAINGLLDGEFGDLRNYFCIIRYEHNDKLTELLSSLCDIRIIWGGNNTIHQIRKAPLPPRAIEMAFADRYSIAIINADRYLEMDEKEVAKAFYTDTYYSDQNACSSPRLVVWCGRNKEQARETFWKALYELAKRDYELQPVQAIDKLDSYCLLAAKATELGVKVELASQDNYLYRVQVDRLCRDIFDMKEAGGYFFEYEAAALEEIVPVMGKTCQTVALLGVDKDDVWEIVEKHGVRGVDRIVPIGKTMELSFYWDGYDMIETMSRLINRI